MKDPKELRIGNVFKEKLTQKEIFVLELSEAKTVFSGEFKGAWQAEPIPLTEEILLRCGFESLGKRGFITTYRHKYIEDLWFKDISISSGIFIFKSLEIECEGLHYLQNLTFFNTEKELELTPNP